MKLKIENLLFCPMCVTFLNIQKLNRCHYCFSKTNIIQLYDGKDIYFYLEVEILMGKCKKRRIINNPILENPMSRVDAICLIIKNIRANELDTDTKNLLTLFGISQEELVEAGATYEELSILKRHM